jgi:SagB-type dehydrogenase family enzyme
VRRYHALSTHHPNRFARGPRGLDWATQPEPFRTYAGASRVELPLPAGSELAATWEEIHRPGAGSTRALDRSSLGAFLELALGLTAWKQAGASRWALRANPSSGNLHPTEGYVLLPGVPGVEAGLYHYAARDHLLERRWTPDAEGEQVLARRVPAGGFLLGLASIHWREAWKYGVRAFRYCQHDVGHALATARYAAGVLGWSARLLEAPGDDDVAAVLGLDRDADHGELAPPDREHPDALLLVAPSRAIPGGTAGLEEAIDALVALGRGGTWAGRPNALSPAHVEWEEVDAVAAATRKPRTGPARESPFGGRGDDASPPLDSDVDSLLAASLIRQRRSAVDMDGRTGLPLARLLRVLGRLLPRPGVPPWDVLPWSPRVHPVLFVHRVDGLAAGLYLFERSEEIHADVRAATRPGFAWERPEGVSAPGLFRLEEGDCRSLARFVSCQQAIAADSAFSLGMLSRFDDSLEEGPWWYRRLFWETGVMGQALYMEAESAGLRGTGIGCYFDDVVHEVLGLEDTRFRDLYHFTLGGAVDDPRLATLSPYPEDVRRRP